MLSFRIVPRTRFVLLLAFAICGVHYPDSFAQVELPDFGDFSSDFDAPGGEVTVEAQFSPATAEKPAMLFVTLNIPDGYHVYAIDQPAGGPMPTSLAVSSDAVQVTGPWTPTTAPKVHIDTEIWDNLEMREHHGQITWYAPITIRAGVDPSTLEITGQIDGQSCDASSCLPFSQSFAARQGAGIAILSKPSPPSPTPSEDADMPMWQLIGSALLGGLILNLMPCVLPVIGLKVLSFAKQGGQSRFQILALNFSYAFGILVVFMILATLASLVQLGLGNESFGWGELNTLPQFKISMSALVFAMALSFLGIWELPIPGFASSNTATELSSREGLFGAFMMGVFTTILATPCSGPFLGSVFGYLITQPAEVIYAIFGSVGLGMALPYLLIGIVPSLVSWLPKPGAWMDTFKQLLGFVLLGTVIWLMSGLPSKYFIATLTLLFGIWFACWWIGRTPLTATSGQRRTAWLGGTTVATIIGLAAFMLMTPGKSVLPWQDYTPGALAEARAEGKTVLVDFTAQWCLTCKTNLKLAINRQEVKEKVEENGVVALLADWTNPSPMIKQALLEHNSQSIPLLVIYPADSSREPIVLRDLLSKKKVLEALDQAGPSKGYPMEGEVQTASSSAETSNRYPQKSALQ